MTRSTWIATLGVVGAKTEAFTKAVKVPVHIPLSGKTMEFDAAGKCTAGC